MLLWVAQDRNPTQTSLRNEGIVISYKQVRLRSGSQTMSETLFFSFMSSVLASLSGIFFACDGKGDTNPHLTPQEP
jgi:hypothetical protein